MSNDFEKEGLEALKIHLAEHLNTVWKTFTALIISIGWLMASDETRDFLRNACVVKYVFMGVALSMAAMHWLTLDDLYKKATKIKNSLSLKIDILTAISNSYEIKRTYTYAGFTINSLLYILLIVTLWKA